MEIIFNDISETFGHGVIAEITDSADNQLAIVINYAILVLKNYERCKNNKTARFV